MRHDEVAEQIDYLYWVRDRILAAAAGLTEVEFQSADAVTTRSLRATLAHQVECEWAWRIRLSRGSFPEGDVLPADYPALAGLADRWRLEERELRAWLATLSDGDLAAQPQGAEDDLATWRYLLYVVNHGVQQLSEAAIELTRLGRSPGEIGYLAFCFERGKKGARKGRAEGLSSNGGGRSRRP